MPRELFYTALEMDKKSAKYLSSQREKRTKGLQNLGRVAVVGKFLTYLASSLCRIPHSRIPVFHKAM